MKKALALLLTILFVSLAVIAAEAEITDTGTDIFAETDTEIETETGDGTETDTREETEPPAHELVFVPEIPATCTESGVMRHYVCQKCGKIFPDIKCSFEITDEEELVIAPTGHKWGEWETVTEPGEYTPGVRRRFCENTPYDTVLTVTLDAGHGKRDNKGVINGYYEGIMSFTLMSYLKAELEKYRGLTVYTTRETLEDEPPLEERGKLAADNGSDLFISLHSNWFSRESACGVSVYRSFIRPESEELGSRLGLAVTELINEVTGKTYMRNDGHTMTRIEEAYDETCGNGVMQDYYCVTRNSVKSEKCRYSYIIEHGFHSNKAECRFLMDDENLQKLAAAEAEVIASYFGLYLKGTEPPYEKHVEYEEIPPVGSQTDPIIYEKPDGFEIDAEGAYPGGTTVRLKELCGEELENAVSGLPDLKTVCAFDVSAAILEWEISPRGKIRVSFPYPENKEDNAIGVIYKENGRTARITVEEDGEAGTASVTLSNAGTYIIFLYGANDVIRNDVNGDGSVDNKDVVALFRYLSGEDIFIEKRTADTDGDGDINNKDAVTLFRILSGDGKE